MRIVLDTLGGDRSPAEIVAGGVEASRQYGVHVVFAGDRALVEAAVEAERERHRLVRRRQRHLPIDYSILDAQEAISMDDAPADAVRRKQQSSLVQGIRLLRQGQADAFVSPANTGAVMTAALLHLGRIPGIERPGIGLVLPTLDERQVLLIDVGANVDCNAENLLQFAIMGRIYAQEVLGVPQPRIALLNIGAESGKGNQLAQKAFALLRGEFEQFVGNIESNAVLQGCADVVVCDGFWGNICLKAYEGGSAAVMELLKRFIPGDLIARLGAYILQPVFRRLKRELSPARFGGAPLLGVRGVVIVAHGNSNAEAICNAVRVARSSVEHQLVQRIHNGWERHQTPTAALETLTRIAQPKVAP